MTVIMDLPDYAVSPNPDLWNVSENGDAFVWSDNNRTAALSVQVEAVCGPVVQKHGGLPSLTAVLFLIDAMTEPIDLQTAERRVAELFRPVREILSELSQLRVTHWLVACGQLKADLRKGPARQGALLSDLMEDAPASLFDIQSLQAIDAMHWLRLSLYDREVTYIRPQSTSQLKSALAVRTLHHFAMSPLNDTSVRLRMETGLSELPSSEPTVELPPARQYSRLLDDLRDDKELGQLIQMASNAASTIDLPRRPSDPDELQVGGVSDITNRGQPERLLATELAADPDLLMARIAHGQALYLRRESPPKHKALRRRVLIENGVRLWGLMRLRATAFALAIAAFEERSRGPQLDVITVAGSNYWADDLSTRDGLVAQLSRLEPDSHPGNALVQLAETWEADTEEFAEPLLIVSRNTFRDAEFQMCLNDFPRPYLLARIDKDGLVELLHCTRSGNDVFHKQLLDLPLKKLLAAKGPSGELPMLLQQRPCPLRFSTDLSVRWANNSPGPMLWTLTHDRRLMCFDTLGVGAIDVATLPGEIVRACPYREGMLLVVNEPIAGTQKVRHLLIHANSLGDIPVHNLGSEDSDEQNVRFEFDDYLLRIGRELTFFDLEGDILATEPLGARRHLGGCFFYTENCVWMSGYFNNQFKWNYLGQPKFSPGFAFYSDHGGIIVYSSDFSQVQILDGIDSVPISTGVSVNLKSVPKLLYWPAPGSVIVEVETATPHSYPDSPTLTSRTRRLFSLEREKVREVTNNYVAVLKESDPRVTKLPTTKSVRNRLQGIAIVDGSIVLFKNSTLGFAIDIAASPQYPTRVVLRKVKSTSQNEIVNFEQVQKVDGLPFRHQWTLKKAVLPQGEAWLDSRGLLHLRARDGSELSLVLHDNHVSGWHSDGSLFGIQYFINRPDTPVPESVEAWLKEFAIQ